MNASVPINFNAENLLISKDHPNIAQTLWSTIASHNKLTYYFCNTRVAEGVWVDMKNNDYPLPQTTSCFKTVIEQEEKGEITFINVVKSGLINTAFTACKDPYTIKQNHSVLI